MSLAVGPSSSIKPQAPGAQAASVRGWVRQPWSCWCGGGVGGEKQAEGRGSQRQPLLSLSLRYTGDLEMGALPSSLRQQKFN